MDGLQGSHAADMKLELGGRMTYDVTQGAFAAQQPRASTTPGARLSAINRSDSYTESKPFASHLFEPHLFEQGVGTREPFRTSTESSSMAHDIAAAAMGTFKLTRPVQAQQRVGMGERPASLRAAN
jgi:hypothetical protein